MSDRLTDDVLKWTSDVFEIPLALLKTGKEITDSGQVQSGAVTAPGGFRQAPGGPAKATSQHSKPARPALPATAKAQSGTAAPPAVNEQQTKFEKAMLKKELITTIEMEVIKRYAHLKTGILDTINKEKQVVEKLKTAAPKGPGSLLAVLGEVFIGVAMIAFPELIVVKVAAKSVATAAKAVDEGIKVKEIVEKVEDVKKLGALIERQNAKAEAEAAKSEFASKMAAMDALLNFADKAGEMIDSGGEAFAAKAKAAIMAWDPPPNFHQKYIERASVDMDMVTEFLGQQMHITKPGGTADDVKKVQTALASEISKWLKQQYVEDNRIKKTLEKHNGLLIKGNWILSTGFKSEEDAQEAARDYLKEHPEEAKKIDEELKEDYTDEFLEKVMGEKA